MLNVIKFFKRAEDSEVVSLQEFEALKDGLELYGVNKPSLISEMKSELLKGKRMTHYKMVIKKQILSNMANKDPAMIKLFKECDVKGPIPLDMDKYLSV